MSGQPPALFYTEMVKSMHEIPRDLPEDFFQRVETGVDEDTRLRLRRGLKASIAVNRFRRIGFAAFVIGMVSLAASGATRLLTPAYQEWTLLVLVALAAVTLVAYAVAFALFAMHRKDVHSFLAFVHAARRSSLGRDLS